MRFLNTSTLHFEEVPDSQLHLPKNAYAILSHRWGAADDEISFSDITSSADFTSKKGFAKLKGFCDLAASQGYRYAWDDTCCINKGDSSELAEAINSMYRWYQASAVCLVYLEDVSDGGSVVGSGWFNRGWTLQELIGPKALSFHDRDWKLIGTKQRMLGELAAKTGIPESVLSHAVSPSACSVAQRMSWAAKRETTRVEDRAYSLLGIFGISMPSIYGEREKAFLRLQRAIIQQSKDESIFSWSIGAEVDGKGYTGLFAASPDSFIDCSDVVSTRGSTGFSEINGELSISLKTYPYTMGTYYAVLNSTERAHPDWRTAIFIGRLSTEHEYVRVNRVNPNSTELVTAQSLAHFKERPIRVSLDPIEGPLDYYYGFWLRTLEPPGHQDCQPRTLSNGKRSTPDRIYLEEGDKGTAGIVYMEPKTHSSEKENKALYGWSKIRWIKLGFDDDFNPMIYLANGNPQMPTPFRRAESDKPSLELFTQATAATGEEEGARELERKVFDSKWITEKGGVPDRQHGWRNGIAILKVDSRKGLHGTLSALNLGISVQLVPDMHAGVDSSRIGDGNRRHDRRIWVVDITDAGGSDPEVEFKEFDKRMSNEESFAACMACCFDCDTKETDAVAARRREAEDKRKVLGAGQLRKSK